MATKLTNRQNLKCRRESIENEKHTYLEKGGTQNETCKMNTENTSYQKHVCSIQPHDSEECS